MRNFHMIMVTLTMLLVSVCAVSAEDLDQVKKNGSLSMAMSGQYPPFNLSLIHI